MTYSPIGLKTGTHAKGNLDGIIRREFLEVCNTLIATGKVDRLERKDSQPKGIIWEESAKHQLGDMPLLYELQSILNKNFSRREEQSYAYVETSAILPRDDIDG